MDTPVDGLTPAERSAKKKTCILLCVISLVLQFAPSALSSISSEFIQNIKLNASDTTTGSVSLIIASLTIAAYIASWVLMIIARVKFKESKFPKVLMWIYIGLLIAYITLIIIAVAMCSYIVSQCRGF